MIYILSLNPSIDYHMQIDDLILGETNRSIKETMLIGGKGINVASLLNELETKSTLVGFIGGDTGNFIVRQLNTYPYITNAMIQTQENTRINVKLKGSVETEINGKGSPVSQKNIDDLELFFGDIKEDDLVVITGKVAEGMPEKWYTKLAHLVNKKKAELVVDIASQELLDICEAKPLLIKPNISELEQIFNQTIKTDEDIVLYARKLIDKGAKHCIVSLGSKGSMLITKDKVLKASVPKGKLVSSVGAGDSMVAGFIYQYKQNKNIKDAYRFASASGSATAYSEALGSKEKILTLLKEIEIGENYGT